MYIITEKNRKEILGMGKCLDYMENGYPRLIEENIAFPTEMVDIYEVETVPEEVELFKYCYDTEQGFYFNPDWREPTPPEQLYTLDEAATILAQEVSA